MGAGWGRTAALVAAGALVVGTVAHVHAAEAGFLEMLFGARPQPQPQVQQAQPAAPAAGPSIRRRARVGLARHRLRTRYAALPVKIHIGERPAPAGDRQVSIDMRQGAAAALLKDETLRPGDIVVLNTGARVFTGDKGKRHAMSDFEPVQRSSYVDKATRRLLAGMMTPVGALPADEARRLTARLRKVAPAPAPAAAQTAAIRVINPWQAPQ